ncbi:enoyl-ACP reductase FabI [Candidatus Nesciobacter abundans]|uniref:Enoyl-[acyl-carrier-protein] reductase [NADH] n=1 Tax=Candidatus Nesciobacter abundans TaxID=2601668 RepID=A0A5C0UHW2_9PROT|nr:enoyl-ACP reductase [Candidatus Nesciobacter abundans]
MGVANKMSIAYGALNCLLDQGAEVGFSYHPLAAKRAEKIQSESGSSFAIECDVEDPKNIERFFQQVEAQFGKIDFLVHSIAFANTEDINGNYYDVPKDGFLKAMNISCFSFTSAAKYASKIMNENGSMVTMSYYGAEKYIPNYNVMGVAKGALETSVRYLANDLGVEKSIKVNCISAGPIRTLAASAISDFKKLLDWHENNSPIRRNTTITEVGNNVVFLASDLSSGVTGQVIYVDSGYHTIGVKGKDSDSI